MITVILAMEEKESREDRDEKWKALTYKFEGIFEIF